MVHVLLQLWLDQQYASPASQALPLSQADREIIRRRRVPKVLSGDSASRILTEHDILDSIAANIFHDGNGRRLHNCPSAYDV